MMMSSEALRFPQARYTCLWEDGNQAAKSFQHRQKCYDAAVDGFIHSSGPTECYQHSVEPDHVTPARTFMAGNTPMPRREREQEPFRAPANMPAANDDHDTFISIGDAARDVIGRLVNQRDRRGAQ